ncbi:ATP-binding cassette domain-containing protein [Peptoniphilus sp.]|uniref:ATP-binding cassette domain-containing protein n=1 Tax=Peptoniphilus sp. TaxID=1971214 RepID=UPI003993120E
MSAILIKDLSKKIGKDLIFNSLNLEVQDGEFFALLAPEKKGKTTLARIIFNFLKPSQGKVLVYDMDVTKDSKTIKEGVAYVPSEIMFEENAKASSIFNKTLSQHNLSNKDELNNLLDYFNFDQRQKFSDMTERDQKLFSVINALIFKPRLIVLDDTTKDLTNDDNIKLFSYLRSLKEEYGLTVLMLSDDLPMAQSYFDRVAILKDGEVKDIEFVKDRISNDKVLVIKGTVDSLKEFEAIGARVIRDDLELHELYFNGSMIELTKIINDKKLRNYSIFDSTLDDKVKALQFGPLPKFENNNYKEDHIVKREYDEVEQVVVEPKRYEDTDELDSNTEKLDDDIVAVDNIDDTLLFNSNENEVKLDSKAENSNVVENETETATTEDEALIKEKNDFDESTFVNISHMVETELENKEDTVIIEETKEDK